MGQANVWFAERPETNQFRLKVLDFIYSYEDIKRDNFFDPIETEITEEEGRLVLRQHLTKERSNKLISAFKRALASYNCQVCGFNFKETYGDIGRGFIEAHHTKPVSSLNEKERISTRDLIAVCSNCHRILHRKNPPLDWKKLKERL